MSEHKVSPALYIAGEAFTNIKTTHDIRGIHKHGICIGADGRSRMYEDAKMLQAGSEA